MGGIFRSVKLQAVRQKSIVGGRLREKSIADGRLREKSTCPRAIAAHGSQALFLPCREKDRGDYPYKYRDELDIPVRIKPVEALLDAASDDTWPAIRELLRRETKYAISGFSSALSAFNLDEADVDKMLIKLEEYARSVVESKAREEAGRVLIRMKDR
ncbi:hypothetical protein GW17_00020020 [Ensete ventricosum]|nr:hypothetical protein GW17_00020020 [Ensete ventricosum]